jgi:hypothetical protein
MRRDLRLGVVRRHPRAADLTPRGRASPPAPARRGDAVGGRRRASIALDGARVYVRGVNGARSALRTSFIARVRIGAAVAFASLAFVAPATATAAPTIVAAGIDATDRFVASWTLEPGTTFDFLEFSSVAISNPFIPGSFAGRNVVASACVAPAEGCIAPPTLIAFRSPDPVARDRRYFVKVNSRKGGRGPWSSQVWVIDKEKPLLPGGGRPAVATTNTPTLGQPYTPPAARTIPTPRLALQSPPKKIADVVRSGVRADVTCPAYSCYAIIGLKLGKTTLVFGDVTATPGQREAFRLRPRPARRAALQRRTKARLVVTADVLFPGGKRVQLARRFTVRR